MVKEMDLFLWKRLKKLGLFCLACSKQRYKLWAGRTQLQSDMDQGALTACWQQGALPTPMPGPGNWELHLCHHLYFSPPPAAAKVQLPGSTELSWGGSWKLCPHCGHFSPPHTLVLQRGWMQLEAAPMPQPSGGRSGKKKGWWHRCSTQLPSPQTAPAA